MTNATFYKGQNISYKLISTPSFDFSGQTPFIVFIYPSDLSAKEAEKEDTLVVVRSTDSALVTKGVNKGYCEFDDDGCVIKIPSVVSRRLQSAVYNVEVMVGTKQRTVVFIDGAFLLNESASKLYMKPTSKEPLMYDAMEPFFIENISDVDGSLSIETITSTYDVYTFFNLYYSTDLVTWNLWGSTSAGKLSMPMEAHKKVWLIGDSTWWASTANNVFNGFHFFGSANATFSVGGNICTLYKEHTPPTSYMACRMFLGFSSLRYAHELILPDSAIRLQQYRRMFENCTSLETPPSIPHSDVVSASYAMMQMFLNCYSLLYAPKLYFKNSAPRWEESIFANCSQLIEVWNAVEQPNAAHVAWLNGVAPSGVVHINPKSESVWSRNSVNGIPSGWTAIPDFNGD